MLTETEKTLKYFCDLFGSKRMCDTYRTFEHCSKDSANQRYLVNSQVKTISFDLLTKWLYGPNSPQSADSLSITKRFFYLIEFKAGNQVGIEAKRDKLIQGVSGKINDSERTLYDVVFPNVVGFCEDNIKLRFVLVVDTKEMGISALVTTLAQLSLGQSNLNDPGLRELFNKVLPDLKANVNNPDRFDKIDIWFSELFDDYLVSHGIIDIVRISEEILSG